MSKEDIFDDEQIELIVKELLKGGITTFGRGSGLYDKIQRVAANLGFIRQPKYSEIIISNNDYLKCTDKLWDYLIVGFLAPGLNSNNPGFPWVHITEYGKKVLEGDSNPYSANEYILDVQNRAKKLLDDTAEDYLFEALRSFRHNCYLGATVLLGGFSERIFLNFLNKFVSCIRDQNKKNIFVKKINNSFITGKFNSFIKLIEPIKKSLPKDIKDQIDLWLSSFFNYIRRVRNDVGHPTGKSFTRSEVLAVFLPFPSYLENLEILLNYLKSNPIQ